jgi:23S rRNA pseudouridine1911/1915/1917 synthase
MDHLEAMSHASPLQGPGDFVVDESASGIRLDAFLAKQLPQHSRVQLRRAIDSGHVTVGGSRPKASYRVRAGDRISVTAVETSQEGPEPENVPLDILYEDDWMVAVNKPPGMVVHPSRGHWSGTLAAALAFHFEQLSSIGGATRPGILHRLDRDTSGVIVVAKTDRCHLALAAQFEQRTTEKEYLAIVSGTPDRDQDLIDQPIGAHPHQREKKAIRREHSSSREAQTFYTVQQRFRGFAAIDAYPRTGRTHQIRLHLAHIGCPVLCDRLYSGRARITLGEIMGGADDGQVVLDRQALHARRLALAHPATGRKIEFQAPLPQDLTTLLEHLVKYRA